MRLATIHPQEEEDGKYDWTQERRAEDAGTEQAAMRSI